MEGARKEEGGGGGERGEAGSIGYWFLLHSRRRGGIIVPWLCGCLYIGLGRLAIHAQHYNLAGLCTLVY